MRWTMLSIWGQTSSTAAFVPIVQIAGTADGWLACFVEVTWECTDAYMSLSVPSVCSCRMCEPTFMYISTASMRHDMQPVEAEFQSCFDIEPAGKPAFCRYLIMDRLIPMPLQLNLRHVISADFLLQYQFFHSNQFVCSRSCRVFTYPCARLVISSITCVPSPAQALDAMPSSQSQFTIPSAPVASRCLPRLRLQVANCHNLRTKESISMRQLTGCTSLPYHEAQHLPELH
ncbi:hypothetical protein V8C26DRAFT_412988 [Trichoderma gracile]